MDDKDKLDEIKEVMYELSSDFKTHIKIEEIAIKSINSSIEQLARDIKEQRLHFDSTIHSNRDHFDKRINTCSESINKLLKEEYITRDEVQIAIDRLMLDNHKQQTEALKEQEKTILTRLRTYAGIAIGTVSLLIALLGYIAQLYFKP